MSMDRNTDRDANVEEGWRIKEKKSENIPDTIGDSVCLCVCLNEATSCSTTTIRIHHGASNASLRPERSSIQDTLNYQKKGGGG